MTAGVEGAVAVKEKTRWMKEMEKDPQFSLVLELQKADLDGMIKLIGMNHPPPLRCYRRQKSNDV